MVKLKQRIREMQDWTRSPNTNRGYKSDFALFEKWCHDAGRPSLPTTEETVMIYLAWLMDEQALKTTTAGRRITAIAFAHQSRGMPSPVTTECWRLINAVRRQRKEQPKGKAAISVDQLIDMSQSLDGSARGLRDRAILILGFASGLRRSEMAALQLDDIFFDEQGLAVTVRSSKRDQEGKGVILGIFPGKRACTDPVRALKAWLRVRGKEPGPLFLRVQTGDLITKRALRADAINKTVQRVAKGVGMNWRLYGAHSLRAGLTTAAAEGGASDEEIMRATRHRSPAVMRQYIRSARIFAVRNPLGRAL